MQIWVKTMRNRTLNVNRRSKKGITLVELIVAMTLTSIFAVLCVMLINPIERTYRGTLKLARAQLLADTLVDSIRKECDDVRHDETTDVWITNLSGNDDAQLFSDGPANKASSGNTLVFRRNNNYTEAIYAAVGISNDNYTAVTSNALTPEHTAHSIDTLKTAGSENMNAGYVHFGYYQAKEDNRGIFPIESYDYTNPVMAKTYGDFNVKLNFYDLKLRDSKYPAYVMCKLTIMEKGKEVYSRSAVLCFAANGSGKGSGSHHVVPPTLRDIEVNVVWDDKGAVDKRPADGLAFVLRNNAGTALGTHNIADVRSTDQQRFVFKNINTKDGFGLSITPDTILEYDRTIKQTSNGYIVKYTRVAEVRLIPGPDFNTHVAGKGITSFIFGAYDDYKSNLGSAKATPVAERKKADGTYETVDDYKLYIVDFADGSKVAYVLSDSGSFNGNPIMGSMFMNCSDVTQFTNLDSIDTSVTVDMHRVFMNCYKVSMPLFKLNWKTPLLETTDGMFRNFACDDSCCDVTIDVSSFDFSNCHYYHKDPKNAANNIIGINKMFFTESSMPSHIKTIRFPTKTEFKNMKDVPMLQQVFSNCINLENLENFNNCNFSGVTYFSGTFEGCTSLKSVDFSNWTLTNDDFLIKYNNKGPFATLTNLETINLNGLKISLSDISGLLDGLGNIQTVYLNKLNAPNATVVNNLFKGKSKLTTVYMNGSTICTVDGGTWTAEYMFNKCSALKTVELNGLVNNRCTSVKSMFEDSKVLEDISGLNSWTTTSVTDFSRMFYNTGADLTTDEYIIDVSGFRFNTGDGVGITMTSMFNGSAATKIKFPATGGVKNATSINGMFQNCKNLSEVENFILNTDSHTDAEAPELSFPNLTGIGNLFSSCSGLKNVKLNISAPKCETISYMFFNCNNMASLDLSGSDFSGCTKISNFLNPNSALKTVYMNEVDLSKCTTADGSFDNMFSGAGLHYLYMNKIKLDGAEEFSFLPYKTLKELYLQEASLSAMTVLEGRFREKTVIEKFDISYAKFGAYDLGDNYLSASQMFIGCTNLKTVIAKGFKAPKNLSEMFSGCTKLTTVDFENCDTSKTTMMNKMFLNCSSMEDFSSLSALNTTNVTTMESMFDGCLSAHGFDSSGWANWSTSNVTTMKNMFHFFGYKAGVTERYTVNIKNFDFSKVKSFYQMFSCDEKEPNARDTISKIILPEGSDCVVKAAAGSTETYRMFRNRWRLETIENVQYFKSEVNITDAQSTFAGTGLTELDISAFDFDKVVTSNKKAQWMFNENYKLEKIFVNPACNYASFSNNNSGVEMFKLDKKLEGPNGTRYVTEANDKLGIRARIDEDEKPGYFRVK